MKDLSFSPDHRFHVDSHTLRGVSARQFGERALAVFHLGRDVGSLNPRYRRHARKLLVRMNRRNSNIPPASWH